MTPDSHCENEELQKLLADSLTDREEMGISDHLAICPDCRKEFEILAAANEWWTEAGQRLSRNAARRSSYRSSSAVPNDDDIHFTLDFAVDFLEPSDDQQALGRLGEYEIVEVIGRGGMGIVLKGFQKELHRHVAVKVLSPHLATSGAARRRFAREAQATAAVVHPHVMAIHSVNASAKLPYLVMPLVDCESLQQRLDRQGPLDLKDVLRIGMQAALGLAAAHAQGLVHRDVKPANILLETNVDRVLLTDFGLARAVDDATLTRTGVIAGTPQYMSPEQANGDAVDSRSDLFSLGGVLYAMCTARPPFRAETTFGVLRRIRETAPRSIREINPDIPSWFERITMTLLAKDANSRFATAQDVASVLEQCLAHIQQPNSTATPACLAEWGFDQETKAGWSLRAIRHVNWATACVGAALVSLMIIAVYFSPNHQAPRETEFSQSGASAQSWRATDDATSITNPIPEWNAGITELSEAADLIDSLETRVNDEDRTNE